MNYEQAGQVRVCRVAGPAWNEMADGPWRYGMTAVSRAVANPTGYEPLPTCPYPRSEHEQAISYWAALYWMLKYSLGWTRPALGVTRFLKAGNSGGDPRLDLLDQVWKADGYLDLFVAWLWATDDEPDPMRPDREWFERQERRAQELTWPPYTGGSDPLHLQNIDHVANIEQTYDDTVFLTSSVDERTAVLVLDSFEGWYASLRRLGGTLPDLGNRSWHVDIVVRGVGWLGAYRRSRKTGQWFSGKHRFHALGN